MRIGKLVSISNMRVEILLDDCKIKPRDIVSAEYQGKTYRFEISTVAGNIATAIPFDSVNGLTRGIDVSLLQMFFAAYFVFVNIWKQPGCV